MPTPKKPKKNSPEKKPFARKIAKNEAASIDDCPIIGIGASAGGLQTLETFFSKMVPDCHMAFVIIQHLSPQHKSIMASLLQKHTKMKVREIEDGIKVQPDCVYLNPPGKNVAIINRTLQLMTPEQHGYVNMPVDFFFRSLAQELKEKSICIILSGTASDGTLGIKAVKDEGGMAMVQDPETAKYDGMPRSAVATGLIDFILPVENMPEALMRYIHHPFIETPDKITTAKKNHAQNHAQNHLQKVYALIRAATGHDFSHYKPTTIKRRIERRMAVHQINKLTDYILFLQKNTAEIHTLFKDLVIGVTSFFRDPATFKTLEEEVLPSLISNKEPDTRLRLWVAGCSTGEEAYTLAMILSEIMDKLNRHLTIQIFATDIDKDAIEVARAGVYPKSIAEDVSSERLTRFFIKDAAGYKIKKQIRDMVVFSIHNIIKDPPFSRLDLVSCRNLMIYMDSFLQKKILPLFHYTLNADGILFLGTSETIGEFTDFFMPINSKLKIFKRRADSFDRVFDYSVKANSDTQQQFEHEFEKTIPLITDIQSIAEKIILDNYSPPAVVINEHHEIIHFVGATDAFLVPPKGKATFNILKMVREELKQSLATTIHKAVREKTKAYCRKARIKINKDIHLVDITVKPLAEKGLPQGSMLVVFEEVSSIMAEGKKPAEFNGKKPDEKVKRLEQELASAREYLQSTIEELETANEELKSTNEEMQSVNEELQSTNEEQETSKEELQSTNEELATVNSELQHKVDELSKTGDDLKNLLASSKIATIFLDIRLCIKQYTPDSAAIIKLIQTDIGRPLNDLKTSFPDVDLAGHANHVLKTLNSVELEALSQDQTWYRLTIIPYRTIDNVIDGVVMTFIDIHKIKQADKIRRLAVVLQDAYDAVTVQDFNGKIIAWNKGAKDLYGWSEEEALKMNAADLSPAEGIKALKPLLAKLKTGERVAPFKIRRKTKTGEILDVWVTTTVLTNEQGDIVEFATTERNLAWLTGI